VILVTGGAGFIGSNLIETLAMQNYKIRAVDCFLKESYDPKIKRNNWRQLKTWKNVELVEFDLRHEFPKNLLDGVEYIINLAAMPGLMQSWSDFNIYDSCNIRALFNLLHALEVRNIQNFIHISTSSVYGKLAIGNESDATSPISPYGLTKLAAEELVQMWHRNQNLQFTILRYFSVYGPHQRPDMAYSKFISAILDDKPIDVFGDGTQSRTNTYVQDCVEGTILALKLKATNEVMNISGVNSTTISDAILQIEERLGKRAKINWLPARPGDQLVTKGEITKARNLLGYNPKVSFIEGIDQQINWYRTNI
jgi:nucleoside-diphosphate-sugar epimerase